MDWFVKAFVKASLVWFGLGATLGVAMAVHPPWSMYRTAHFHLNLLGFVTMMIFGVAYHVIPRFTGNSLHSRRLAGLHWWVANAGLSGLVLGFVVRPSSGASAMPLLGIGGGLAAIGAYTFAYNIWRTLDAVRQPYSFGGPPRP
jgi:cbb3-type cytochrome oxidase subunit 1